MDLWSLYRCCTRVRARGKAAAKVGCCRAPGCFFPLHSFCFALLCLLACLHFSCPLLVLLARPSEILLLLLLNNNNNKNDKKKKKKKKNALAMLV